MRYIEASEANVVIASGYQCLYIQVPHDDPDLIEKIDRICVSLIVDGDTEAAKACARAYHMRFSLVVKRNSKRITFGLLKSD